MMDVWPKEYLHDISIARSLSTPQGLLEALAAIKPHEKYYRDFIAGWICKNDSSQGNLDIIYELLVRQNFLAAESALMLGCNFRSNFKALKLMKEFYLPVIHEHFPQDEKRAANLLNLMRTKLILDPAKSTANIPQGSRVSKQFVEARLNGTRLRDGDLRAQQLRTRTEPLFGGATSSLDDLDTRPYITDKRFQINLNRFTDTTKGKTRRLKRSRSCPFLSVRT